jgi:hypothetical protein
VALIRRLGPAPASMTRRAPVPGHLRASEPVLPNAMEPPLSGAGNCLTHAKGVPTIKPLQRAR